VGECATEPGDKIGRSRDHREGGSIQQKKKRGGKGERDTRLGGQTAVTKEGGGNRSNRAIGKRTCGGKRDWRGDRGGRRTSNVTYHLTKGGEPGRSPRKNSGNNQTKRGEKKKKGAANVGCEVVCSFTDRGRRPLKKPGPSKDPLTGK